MIFLIGYIIIVALGALCIYDLGKEFPQSLLMLLSAFYAIIFFHAVNLGKIKTIYTTLSQHKAQYFVLMFSIFMVWVGYYLGIIYISPTFLDFIYMGLAASYGSFFAYRSSKTRTNLLSMVLINLTIAAFYFLLFAQYEIKKTILIIVFTIALGTFNCLYVNTAYKLSKINLSPTQILASRFWIMLLICLIIVVCRREYEFLITNYDLIPKSILLAAITFIIPIYLYQKAITKLGPNLSLVAMGVVPIVVFILEIMLIENPPSSYELGILSLALAISTTLPYFTSRFQKQTVAISVNPQSVIRKKSLHKTQTLEGSKIEL